MKVYCNTKGVPVTINRFGGQKGYLIIKDYFEHTFTSEGNGGITASCDDPEALITIEIYINGRLSVRKHGNRYLST